LPLLAVKLISRDAVLTCSYCDLEEVERLAALLLEKFCQASAFKHPAKNSDVKTIALKCRMMAVLDITNAATESYSYGTDREVWLIAREYLADISAIERIALSQLRGYYDFIILPCC
jgi:hypothetical protein